MKQVLDLDTLTVRPQIRIRSELHPDGRLYGLRPKGDLSIVEHNRVAQRYKWVTEELSTDDPGEMSEEEARLLTVALDDLVSTIVDDLEGEVLDALSDSKKGQIVEAWMREFYPDASKVLEEGQDPT